MATRETNLFVVPIDLLTGTMLQEEGRNRCCAILVGRRIRRATRLLSAPLSRLVWEGGRK